MYCTKKKVSLTKVAHVPKASGSVAQCTKKKKGGRCGSRERHKKQNKASLTKRI